MASQEKGTVPVWTVKEPYISHECELGEGPYFEEETRTMRYLDILGKKLLRFHVDRGPGSLQTFDTGDAVGYAAFLFYQNGVTANIEGNAKQAIVAAKYGMALMDLPTGKLHYLTRTYPDETKAQRMRSNDGAIDPAGRFLAGTMTDPALHSVENEGALWCLERIGSEWATRAVLEPVKIPNGLGWSADGKTMYHTDSPTYTIWAYDYDVQSGVATNRRAWFVMQHADTSRVPHFATAGAAQADAATIPPDAGPPGCEPDGFAIDANGDLWSAVYGAGKVLRIRDVGGHGVVVGCVVLPAPRITCPRFVDEDLIITSAQGGGGQFGGCTFRVSVGVKGRPPYRWAPGT